jgi:hypothetical protein
VAASTYVRLRGKTANLLQKQRCIHKDITICLPKMITNHAGSNVPMSVTMNSTSYGLQCGVVCRRELVISEEHFTCI